MATTPNYGWVTPAPTDFVTDLPADFETFADAVDADLAGLLGGTTGQVLIKDSNTDHDFSWGSVAAGGMTELASGSLSGLELSLSSISGSYKDLVIYLRDVYPSADDYLRLEINDTANVYFSTNSYTGAQNNAMTSGAASMTLEIDTRDADNFVQIRISDYTNSVNKIIESRYMVGNIAGSNFDLGGQIATARVNAAVTKVDLFWLSGSSFSGGTYILYGVS